LRRAPAFAWLGVAVALAATVPSVQWLVHQTDVDRGLARVTAFMTEPPSRDAFERGITWDFLGIRNYRLERWDAAARALARAVETQPSPRVFHELARAEARRGNLPGARDAYRRALARDSTDLLVWKGLSTTLMQLGEVDAAHDVLAAFLRRNPDDPEARTALRQLEELQRAKREGAGPR
jgi:predicted Zn-dependent protease